ncbi:MAG: CPBP family intramembrane glutamic endopeptidase [Desulfohalobiaceae bacterium]
MPADHNRVTRVPWTEREAWVGVACLGAWMLASMGIVLLVGRAGLRIDPGVLVSLLELPLLLPVWWLGVHRYDTGWKSLGLTGFSPGTLLIGLGLLLATLILNALYDALLSQFGLRAQPDFTRVFEQASSPWPLLVGGSVLIPFVEEVFFRGFVLAGFRKAYGWTTAMLLSSGLFALVHLQPLAIPPIFVLGMVFAYLYRRSGSIWPAVLLHVLMNAMALGGAYRAALTGS